MSQKGPEAEPWDAERYLNGPTPLRVERLDVGALKTLCGYYEVSAAFPKKFSPGRHLIEPAQEWRKMQTWPSAPSFSCLLTVFFFPRNPRNLWPSLDANL